MTSSQTGRSLRGAFVAVTSLFFMWGFITVLVDALIPRLKEVFELTFLQAGLVQFAWFAAYGLLSIPGGNLIARMGYQRGILVGLATAGLGCLLFYPAAATRMYPLVFARPLCGGRWHHHPASGGQSVHQRAWA